MTHSGSGVTPASAHSRTQILVPSCKTQRRTTSQNSYASGRTQGRTLLGIVTNAVKLEPESGPTRSRGTLGDLAQHGAMRSAGALKVVEDLHGTCALRNAAHHQHVPLRCPGFLAPTPHVIRELVHGLLWHVNHPRASPTHIHPHA